MFIMQEDSVAMNQHRGYLTPLLFHDDEGDNGVCLHHECGNVWLLLPTCRSHPGLPGTTSFWIMLAAPAN